MPLQGLEKRYAVYKNGKLLHAGSLLFCALGLGSLGKIKKWKNNPISVSKDNPAYITTDKNYVLMRGSDAKVVEEELGKTSLQVEAHDVTMKGKIGNVTQLKSVNVNASGNVLFNGLVNVDETISVKGSNITIQGFAGT